MNFDAYAMLVGHGVLLAIVSSFFRFMRRGKDGALYAFLVTSNSE